MTTTKDRHGDHKCKLDIMCFLCVENHMMERDKLLEFVRKIAGRNHYPSCNEYIEQESELILKKLGYE